MSTSKSLRYLDWCLKETLRLAPPAPIILRQSTKGAEEQLLGGRWRMRAEMPVIINIMALHYSTWDSTSTNLQLDNPRLTYCRSEAVRQRWESWESAFIEAKRSGEMMLQNSAPSAGSGLPPVLQRSYMAHAVVRDRC